MRRRTFGLAAVSTVFAALVVVVVLTLAGRSDDAKNAAQSAKKQVTTVKQDASVAKRQASTARRDNARTRKTANTANRRSIGTVRFLQGKQGNPGLTGPPGKSVVGARGPAGRNAVFPFAPFLAAVTDELTKRLPSAQDVADACDGACVGADGKDGVDGRDATDAQVAAAVETYCAARNQCRGPQGDPSTVPGPQGPAGADSQVPGPPGPQGPPGVSPTTFLCQPPAPDGTATCVATG